MTSTPPVGRRAVLIVLLIALSAFVPFALAYLYANHPEWIQKTSNVGTLIVPIQSVALETLDQQPLGKVVDPAEFRGRWLLLEVAESQCEAICLESLHKTHQAWLMLNKELPRVRRLLLVGKDGKRVLENPVVKADDALLMAALAPDVLARVHAALRALPLDGSIVLVDPLGNLVLKYGPDFDPYGLVKDLKHLLKASQIG